MTQTLVEALEEAFREARDMEAPLNERLGFIADAMRGLSPVFADAVDRMVERLQRSGAGETAPGPGDPMPPFLLPDETGRLIGLDALLERGPVAVAFHRGHWCPYCRLNTAALAAVHARATSAGRQIVAITPDRQRFSTALKAEAKAPFPILTDMDNGYALALDLTIWVGAELEQFMIAAGVRLPDSQGNDAWMLPIPATFVVGTDRLIAARFLDPDFRKRMEVEDLVRALDAAC